MDNWIELTSFTTIIFYTISFQCLSGIFNFHWFYKINLVPSILLKNYIVPFLFIQIMKFKRLFSEPFKQLQIWLSTTTCLKVKTSKEETVTTRSHSWAANPPQPEVTIDKRFPGHCRTLVKESRDIKSSATHMYIGRLANSKLLGETIKRECRIWSSVVFIKPLHLAKKLLP